MLFHRAGHLEDRRRRMLSEESSQASTATPRSSAPASKPPTAAAAATSGATEKRRPAADRRPEAGPGARCTPRVGELVPRRWSMLAAAFTVSLVTVAGVLALHHFGPQLTARLSRQQLDMPAAWHLESYGGLARLVYLVSMLVAAVGAWVVYSVRRHKPDDYRGRYRVWGWAACLWLVVGFDKSTGLHELVAQLATLYSGRQLGTDGMLWWMSVYVLAFAVIGLRLLLDMRGSRLAVSSLLLASAAWTAAAVVQLSWWQPPAPLDDVLLEEGLELVAATLVMWSMGLHARWVMLGADGLLPRRESAAKPAAKKSAKPAATTAERPTASPEPAKASSTILRTDRPTTGPPGPLRQAVSRATANHRQDDDDDDDDDDQRQHRLSKAERKALRRQQRQFSRDDDDE